MATGSLYSVLLLTRAHIGLCLKVGAGPWSELMHYVLIGCNLECIQVSFPLSKRNRQRMYEYHCFLLTELSSRGTI